MILLQEAEWHFQEIVTIAAQQFHMYQGADQLIPSHKNTVELGGVKTEEVIPGTSKQDSFGLKYLRMLSRQGNFTYTPPLSF